MAFGLLAGGGLRDGQVIGATDRLGGEATDRPVKFGELFATLYHTLGIDVDRTTVNDLSGRPQFLVDGGVKPLREAACSLSRGQIAPFGRTANGRCCGSIDRRASRAIYFSGSLNSSFATAQIGNMTTIK